jgi:5-methylcytosine-specific restriction enzyme subunit McrC
LDRKTEPYSYGLELARLIILNFSPDISTGSEQMLSLLFDMNDLWEEYILRLLKKEAEKSDFKVLGQVSKPFWGSNTLRPDILIEHKGKNYIIDTKWKTPGYYSASNDDLRQMYAYCRFWDAEKALLLYPGEPKGNRYKTFNTEDYSDFENGPRSMEHRCRMGFVSVVRSEGELNMKCGIEILASLFDQ